MPMYEYYCQPCNGIFELLRPVREASKPQPCPECDDDAKRIVSKEFNAFIFREGAPRRLPDDGTYRHMGQKVSRRIDGPSDGYTHPELNPKERNLKAPTLEELEQWEETLAQRRARSLEQGARVIDSDHKRQERAFTERLVKTRGSDKVEKEKRRLVQQGLEAGRQAREMKATRIAKSKTAKPKRIFS